MSTSQVRANTKSRSLRASAPIFAALGDEKRLALVRHLCVRGPQSIARLAEGSGVTRQAITKHLHVLAEAGLVKNETQGRTNVWEFTPRGLEEARRTLDAIAREWDEALERLRRFVED
ncbi:MAG TPA: metalloregulator ArsR/SmtB family transcription factor [Polyangiaceae bacterium]|nr:metalloregulator ArsR/SmtB family transcription factor [Polyangiaceae bacterium]